MAQAGDDLTHSLEETGVVYGYLPDTDNAFLPAAAGAYLKSGTPTDDDVVEGSRILTETSCLTRLLVARIERDIEASFVKTMGRPPFEPLLSTSTVSHYAAVNAIAGPFVSYAPDWCAMWPLAPVVTAAKATNHSPAPPLAVVEITNMYVSVHAAFSQAAVQACSAAFVLHQWGLQGIDACVPFAATNGREEKHDLASHQRAAVCDTARRALRPHVARGPQVGRVLALTPLPSCQGAGGEPQRVQITR